MIDPDIYSLLHSHIEETKLKYQQARERFWCVAGLRRRFPMTPNGRAHPDGSELMRRVVAEESRARNDYIESRSRLSRFLLAGTIPDDILVGRKTKPGPGPYQPAIFLLPSRSERIPLAST
jgi:hypothetical protein